jgi:metal-sulfur cluster biosynthetic enzyme
MSVDGGAFTPLDAPEAAEAFARRMADEVHDPCSMAIGLRIGLAEMGLIRYLAVERGPDGWDVRLQLRLTSPGCQYFYFFRESLEDRIGAHPEVASVEILWDQVFDWTPEDFAASAREKIDARQRRLLQITPRA